MVAAKPKDIMLALGVPNEGRVEGLSLVVLFGRLAACRCTGAIVLDQDGETSRVFFRNGRPSGIVAWDKSVSLVDYLLSRGVIDKAAIEKSLEEDQRKRKSQGRALVDLGLISKQDYTRYLVEHQVWNVHQFLGQTEGVFSFDEKAEFPPLARQTELDPYHVILSLLDRAEETERVGRLLVEISEIELVAVPENLGPYQAELDEDSKNLLRKLDEPIAAVSLVASSGSDIQRSGAILAAAWCLGLVRAADSNDSLQEPPAEASENVSSHEPPVVSSGDDESSQRARRARMLKRAFKNIPGASVLSSSPPRQSGGARTSDRSSAAKSAEAHSATVSASALGTDTLRKGTEPESTGDRDELGTAANAFVEEVVSLSKEIKEQDFYKRLGLSRASTHSEIRAAYLKLVKRFHPDRAKSCGLPAEYVRDMTRIFEAIREANETLSDPDKRAEYDGADAKSEVLDARQQARARAKAEIDFKKGEGLFKKKDFARALEYFEAAIAVDKTKAVWQIFYAWSKYNVGPKEQVIGEVKKRLRYAASSGGEDGLASYYLGLLERINGNLEQAEVYFRAAIEKKCKIPEVASELRDVRRRLGKDGLSKTRSILNKVLKKAKD